MSSDQNDQPLAAEATVEMEEQNRAAPQLLVVRRYSHPLHADLDRAFLEANGVWAILADYHIVAANWLLSSSVGGVKLMVRAADLAAAQALLAEVERGVQRAKGQLSCPRCGSHATHFEKYHRRRAALTLLLRVPLPFIAKRRCCCESCGHEWRELER